MWQHYSDLLLWKQGEEGMACSSQALFLLSRLCSRFSTKDEGAQLNLSVPTVSEKSRKSVCFLWKSVRSKYQKWYGALKHARPPTALRNLWKSITAGVGCKLSFKSKQGLCVFTGLCREGLQGTTSCSVLQYYLSDCVSAPCKAWQHNPALVQF